MVNKRKTRGARGRTYSENMTDASPDPPPKKKTRQGKSDPDTTWVDDDTLVSDDSDSTPDIIVTITVEADDDSDYEPEEEESDPDDEFIEYVLNKFDNKKSHKYNTRQNHSKLPNQKLDKVPLKLSKLEEAYYNKQNVGKKKELLELMNRVAGLVLDDGEVPQKFRVLQLPVSDYIKSSVIKKIAILSEIHSEGGDGHKLRSWLDAFMRIPFGKTVPLPVQLLDGQTKCTDFMVNARKTMDKHIYGMEPAKLQIMQIIAQWIVNPSSVGNVIALQGPMGVGKCHAKDTPILMYDGSIKLVQDINVGDCIMGDNSSPRNVLSLGRGRDEMYDIIPIKGEKYTVNSEHILCLKQSGEGCIKVITNSDKTLGFKTMRFDNTVKNLKYKTFRSYFEAEMYLKSFNEEDNITEISVKDYLKLSPSIKKNWLKIYKKGVEFSSKKVDFDPYIIGLWLGDGNSSSPQIASQDSVILGYLNTALRKYDLMLVYRSKYDYYIRSYKKNENTFLNVLQKNDLLDNKHIPDSYKINDREVRLKVLAGLIDSDGHLSNNCYEIAQKSTRLAEDIVFLSRSLGFACYSRIRNKSCVYKGEKRTGAYNIITISGNISEIPVLLQRKKASERTQIKDVLVNGFRVEHVGEGDYYGFTLDGNNRYLMGDFNVTHNTSFARNAIAEVLKRPFEFFTLGGASDIATYIGHSYTYEGSLWGRIADSLMHAGNMNPVMYFDELDKVSTTPQGEEIVSMMIHMTDRSQNTQFHDRYFAGVDFDLSQCLFVFSFNDIEKVHPILRDRMTVIHCGGYNEKDKMVILKDYIWPQIEERLCFKPGDVTLSESAIKFIISEFSSDEKGVRTLIRTIESMMTRLNMLRVAKHESMRDYKFYMDVVFPMTITPEIVKILLIDSEKKEPETWRSLYN